MVKYGFNLQNICPGRHCIWCFRFTFSFSLLQAHEMGNFPPFYQRGQRWGWGEGRQRVGDGTPCPRNLESWIACLPWYLPGCFPSLLLPDSRFFCPDSIFLSRFSINYSSLFLIPPHLFLSQSFSPLFFPFASLPLIHISSFPSFPFSSLLYFLQPSSISLGKQT